MAAPPRQARTPRHFSVRAFEWRDWRSITPESAPPDYQLFRWGQIAADERVRVGARDPVDPHEVLTARGEAQRKERIAGRDAGRIRDQIMVGRGGSKHPLIVVAFPEMHAPHILLRRVAAMHR